MQAGCQTNTRSCVTQLCLSLSDCRLIVSVPQLCLSLSDYTGWVSDALCLLAVSRGGLRQDEVLQMLRIMGYVGEQEVTVLHWLRFRLHAGCLLWETADGRIRFSHQHLQDITEYTLLSKWF